MKVILISVVIFVTVVYGRTLTRSKRQAYALPDGAELVLGPIKTSFACGPQIGYYADVDNGCRIFHICEPEKQTSYFCGNQSVFNQLTFTCASPTRAIPCQSSPDFFYLNAKIGDPKALFLTPDDIRKAVAARG